MRSGINLDHYFERIGYKGSASVSLETLHDLQEKHTQTIPFENLNPMLGLPVKLDIDSLVQKMVNNKRGGYCYEQNLLFLTVLETIGFQAKGLSARVRWNKTDDEITPKTHMLLRITMNGHSYLADVGFGSQTLTAPLFLEPNTVQETPHEPRRLVQQGKEYLMQVRIEGQWKLLYQFDLRENYLPDYEINSWYLSNHPESHFVTELIAARPSQGKRYTIRNNQFSTYHLDGEIEKKRLKKLSELRRVLEETFLLTLPKVPELDTLLQHLVELEEEPTG
ncbi:MAG: arylamine N-acetyltransferase [Balneolaceae bacterium]|jgi:N-hydroxyarylamine O-acetyltransferase